MVRVDLLRVHPSRFVPEPVANLAVGVSSRRRRRCRRRFPAALPVLHPSRMLPAGCVAPAAGGRAAASQQLRPLSRAGTPAFAAPQRRSFVLRHARAGVRASAAPGDEEPAPQSDMARGVVLGALLSNLMSSQKSEAAAASVEEAPAPTTKPAGVLGAALAALMMVRRAAARRAAPRARTEQRLASQLRPFHHHAATAPRSISFSTSAVATAQCWHVAAQATCCAQHSANQRAAAHAHSFVWLRAAARMA